MPVPNPNRLVIARGHHPRVLLVETHGSDVVQMAEKREKTTAELVVPNLDFVIVA